MFQNTSQFSILRHLSMLVSVQNFFRHLSKGFGTCKQKQLNMFAATFNVESVYVPDNLQHHWPGRQQAPRPVLYVHPDDFTL